MRRPSTALAALSLVAVLCSVAASAAALSSRGGPSPGQHALLTHDGGRAALFDPADGPVGPGERRTECTTVTWRGGTSDVRISATDVVGDLADDLTVRVEVSHRCGTAGRVVFVGSLAELARPGVAAPMRLDGPGELAYRIDVTLPEDATLAGRSAGAAFAWTAAEISG